MINLIIQKLGMHKSISGMYYIHINTDLYIFRLFVPPLQHKHLLQYGYVNLTNINGFTYLNIYALVNNFHVQILFIYLISCNLHTKWCRSDFMEIGKCLIGICGDCIDSFVVQELAMSTNCIYIT